MVYWEYTTNNYKLIKLTSAEFVLRKPLILVSTDEIYKCKIDFENCVCLMKSMSQYRSSLLLPQSRFDHKFKWNKALMWIVFFYCERKLIILV